MGRTTTNTFARGGSTYSLDPHTELRIIGLDTKDGPEHPNYDKRITLPLKESFVATIAMYGVLEPVIGRRDGDVADVVAGRQRTRGARLVNERRAGKAPIPADIPEEWKALYASDKPQILVPTILRRSDEREMQQIQIVENEARTEDTPLIRAGKMKKLEDSGYNRAMIAAMFNITPEGVRQTLKILDASEKLQKACEDGFISASAVGALADLPREEQDRRIDEARASGVRISTGDARRDGIARRGNAVPGCKPPGRAMLRKLVTHENFATGLSTDARSLLAWIATGDSGHIERVKGLKKTLREMGALPDEAA